MELFIKHSVWQHMLVRKVIKARDINNIILLLKYCFHKPL